MQGIRSATQEAGEDLFFGQEVLIWARWFVIAAGATLVLFTSTGVTQLSFAVLPVLVLMGVNFYLHGQFFVERPVNTRIIALAALVDVAVITVLVLFWSDMRGLESPFFVLYYPPLMAFAFVMPRKLTVAYCAMVLIAYVGAVVIVDFQSSAFGDYFVFNVRELKLMVIRVITLTSVGALGTYYWRMQRASRRSAAAVRPLAGARTAGSEASTSAAYR